jgi:hypothetical protein
MGMMTAMGLQELGLPLKEQLSMHFSSNCYPPIPQGMIPTAIEAIEAFWDDELDKMIPLPEGVSFRGRDEVAAHDVINSYRLDAWCIEEE